jgi:signal transduction histidine kinase/CheY-like chemotaxis protein
VQFWAHLATTAAQDADGVPVCRLVISDIADRRRAEAAVKNQNERLHLLWEAARVLLSTDDPDAILRGLLAKIGPPLGVDAYFNYMVDDTGHALRLTSYAGIPEEMARFVERLEFGQNISGTVALQRESIVATHIQQSDDPKAQLVKSFGLRAYASNPLMSDNLLLGTLSFASRTKDQFDPDDLAVLHTISHYVAVACERLRLLNTLRESDRHKNEFLAMLSHELRNPLAPILNAVQLLRLQPDESKVQRQAHTIIERQLGQLVHLVDDLLEVTRISTGKIHLQREQLDMRAIVECSVETVRLLIEQRRHVLTVHLPPSPIWIDGDSTRLEQVVVNLLNNAAKYTDDGGQIGLSLQQVGNEAVLQVRDSGVGIAPELMPHIFDLFTQADRSLARSQGGLGIGLSLVQRLVEMHGGKVTASSVVGQGSEFIVRLPVALTAEPRPPSPPTEKTQSAGSSLRVLVVDDNVDMVTSLAMLLRESGHDVRTAPDGSTALEAALAYRPDVALLDLGLPGLNGFEIAKRMRQQPILQKVVLVAMTGYGKESDRQRSREAGFDHYLVKPTKLEKLQEIFASVSEKAT